MTWIFLENPRRNWIHFEWNINSRKNNMIRTGSNENVR